MRVLLLHPPATRRSYLSRFGLDEPLIPIFLAPDLSRRHELRLVDLRLAPDLRRELAGWRPEVALVGVNLLTLGALDRCLGELRALAPEVRVLLYAEGEYGNSQVEARPADYFHPLADAVVAPYFLAPMREVVEGALRALEDRRPLAEAPGLWLQEPHGSWTLTAPVANRVGDVGVPDRSVLGRYRGRYMFAGIRNAAHLIYTYGCKFKCRFCPMSRHDGTIFVRGLDGVLAELAAMSERNVFLEDYEPFLAPDAMVALADGVERAGIRKNWYMLTRADSALEHEELIARWKKLGLRWLYLGLDGSNPERLREIRKASSMETNERALRRMQALGLAVTAGFVVRPDYTSADFAALREAVARLRPPLVTYTVETPLPGTQLFDDVREHITSFDWSLYDLQHALLPTSLPLEEFYGEMARLHFASGVRNLPVMLRHYPPLDLLRLWVLGMGAVRDLRRSARDHGRPGAAAGAPQGMQPTLARA
ncbi:MAG: radical SAM protein [Planctomycetota bacterium]|nr:MAG: radical SAM protein [Planctomycetota bacterium]